MNKIESRVILEAEAVGQEAWENHSLSQRIDWQEELELSALADDVVFKLNEKDYPQQIFDNVYFWKQTTEKGELIGSRIFASWSGVDRFWKNGEINSILLEAEQPDYNEPSMGLSKKIAITGFNPEETSGKDWKVIYEFKDLSTSKQTLKFLNQQWVAQGENQPLDKADFNLVKAIFTNMSDNLQRFSPMVI